MKIQPIIRDGHIYLKASDAREIMFDWNYGMTEYSCPKYISVIDIINDINDQLVDFQINYDHIVRYMNVSYSVLIKMVESTICSSHDLSNEEVAMLGVGLGKMGQTIHHNFSLMSLPLDANLFNELIRSFEIVPFDQNVTRNKKINRSNLEQCWSD